VRFSAKSVRKFVSSNQCQPPSIKTGSDHLRAAHSGCVLIWEGKAFGNLEQPGDVVLCAGAIEAVRELFKRMQGYAQ
jgi:hypothetical protein